MLHDVVALVHPPVAAFELGVLTEVFGLDRSEEGFPGHDFALAALRPGPLATTSGFTITASHGLERLAGADLVAVPSWPVDRTDVPVELVAALRAVVDRGGRVLSLCSGAFLLAGAGLLEGRRATTHWRYAEALTQCHPGVDVDADVLYVVDGPIITSAGTAAALDACLHLVRIEHGSHVANRLARRMVVAAHREGGQAQFAEQAPTPTSPGLAPVLDWVLAHLEEVITVEHLAARAHLSVRTLARRFHATIGVGLVARLRRPRGAQGGGDLHQRRWSRPAGRRGGAVAAEESGAPTIPAVADVSCPLSAPGGVDQVAVR